MEKFLQIFKIQAVATLLLTLFFTTDSFAQKTWDGGGDGVNWSSANNWAPNGVPTAGDNVVIDSNLSINVNTSTTINRLTITNSATVVFTASGNGTRVITINNTGSSVDAGSSLTLQGSTGSGTRSLGIAFANGGTRTMAIDGTLNLTDVGEGTSYNATNSVTTVTGVLRNSDGNDGTVGTITSTATNLVFASGGTYQHDLNQGTIPTATWNANSTCNVTGVTSIVPTVDSFNQTFGHFIWNCPSQTGNLSLIGNLTTVNGSFIVTNTNSGSLRLSNSGVTETLNVGGNFIQTGGTFYIAGTSNTNTWTVNVVGNFSLTGGTLNLNGFATNDATYATSLNVAGNFTHSAGILTQTATNVGTITLNGTASRTFESTGQTGNIRIAINKNGTATNDIVSLSANSRINYNLTLTDGLLVLGNYNLTLGASTTTITAPGTVASMIVPTGSGEIRRTTTATGSFTYPIGDNTGTLEYSPVIVNVTGGTGFSSAYIGVSLEDAKHANNNSSTNFLTRSWKINQSGITNCVVTVTGTYINSVADVSGTLGSIRAAQLNGVFNQSTNPWIKTGGSVLSGTSLTYTGATITTGQQSIFTGITSANPTVTISGGNVTVCKDGGVTLTAVPVGDSSFVYLWSNGLGTSVTATPSTATVGGPTNYTVTVKDANGISSSASTAVAVTVVAVPVAPVIAKSPNVSTVNEGTTLTISVTTSGTGGTGTSQDEYRFSTDNGVNWSSWGTSIPNFTAIAGTNVIESRRTSTGVGCTTAIGNTVNWIVIATNTWVGTTSSAWDVASNWSIGVPTVDQNILISTNTPNATNLNVDYTLPSGKTLTMSGTGALTIAPQSVLTIAGSANFGNRPVTVKSDATGDGMIGQVSGSLTNATNVTVERYIPSGKRAFRFLTPGVTTTDYISNNWQLATHITGSTTGANGFDATTTGGPSMYTYNNTVASGTGWTAIPSTNATNLEAGLGYRLLIRGDRTPTLITSASVPNMNTAITLSAKGTVKTGTVVVNASSTPAINGTSNTTTNGFSLVGNPYVSAVDWNTVTRSGLTDVYYAWDPNMGTAAQRGRYVTYSASTGFNNLGNSGSSNVGQYIQSGQAFFVKNTTLGTAGTLTFNESNKVGNFASVFRNQQDMSISKLGLLVYEPNELALGSLPIDGAVALFGTDFTNAIEAGDVEKLESAGENLAIFSSNQKLAMSAMAPVVEDDELLLKTLRFAANKSYTFKIEPANFDATVAAYFVDQFLNTETAIDLTQDSFVTVTTTSDVLSFGEDRFKIVFGTQQLGNPDFDKIVSLYPNPSKLNEFNLNLPNWDDTVQVNMFNSLGQQIPVSIENGDGMSKRFRVNTNLSSGVYYIKVTQNGKETTKKWIYNN